MSKAILSSHDQSKHYDALVAAGEWYQKHGSGGTEPPLHLERAFRDAMRYCRTKIFSKLLEQAADTGTQLPANSYEEAVRGLKLITEFPRFMPGPDASARVKEVLLPLVTDFIHLACVLAPDNVDVGHELISLVESASAQAEIVRLPLKKNKMQDRRRRNGTPPDSA